MSNDTRWTKGPWYISGKTVYALNGQGFNRFSALVQDAHTGEEELKANAHLIAAAPELYDALKVAHDNLYALINDPEIGSDVRRLYDLEDVANMAGPLAKARGEQS